MKLIINLLPLLVLLITLSNCKNESYITKDKEVMNLLVSYDKNANKDTLQKLLGMIYSKANELKDEKEKLNLFEVGLDLSKKAKLDEEENAFGYEILRCCFDSEQSPQILATLRDKMKSAGRVEVAQVIAHSLSTNFSNSKEAKSLKADDYKNVNTEWIKAIGASAFDSTGQALQQENSRKYIDVCEAYALTHPKDSNTPSYLFQAAEMARSLGDSDKALVLYQLIDLKYPAAPENAMALFLSGFILESVYSNKPQAKVTYERFLKLFPNHERSKDVKFLVENLFLSEADMIKKFETQN